jgi:tagatose-6-phosphate ketose/aldose isomerase
MEALGLTAGQIDAGGASATAREIAQQPKLWPEIARRVASDTALRAFLTPQLADPELRVVLTGAGSSSFVGECLAPALLRARPLRAEAIATTDIVASPASTLAPRTPTLMVHFARSGSSPESTAVLELAEARIERCAHLIVTCNRAGELYRRAGALLRAHALLLPEACNDQSFAMTSSFTGMLLAAAQALGALPGSESRAVRLGRMAAHVLTACQPLLTSLVAAQFERVVYLGASELKGLAREAALKMLELTDGRVVSTGESPLGFRHGPKTILNGSTLAVVFVSNDAHTRRYDLDLVAELRRDSVAGRVIALAGGAAVPEHRDTVRLDEHSAGDAAGSGAAALTDLELCLPYAVFAQSLAMLRSLSLGLSPDQPNAAGTVSRVVQGVTIYPYGAPR